TPAPNIELENFQYMSPGDRCGRQVDNDMLMRLHSRIKPIAAAAFSDSKANFGVMVRYTLTPDKAVSFEMRTEHAPDSEKERLTRFYNNASALGDFHSKQGTLYVMFQYRVSPAASIKSATGR
ncbi:MAG: hypothetical protein ACREP7_08975, partial [Lysobacter sp.]